MSDGRPVRTPAGVINVEAVNAPAAAAAGQVRSARRGGAVVRVSAIDTWSVTRTGFVLSLAIAIVILVAVLALWGLFTAAGVFTAVGGTADDITGTSSNIEAWFSFPRVAGITLLVGAIEVVLTTAAVTLAASLYNIAAGWAGGVELTLTEQR